MTTRTLLALAVCVSILASTCARGSHFGSDDAVEILVLDGMSREEATCLVNAVEGDLDLAEVTGVSGDLDSGELEALFHASRGCQPVTRAGTGGTIGGSFDDLGDLEELDEAGDIDVEGVVADLLLGGLDPEIAVCVASILLADSDPTLAVSDDDRKLDAIVACEASADGG